MPDYNYRIHPAFGIARVGTSEEYYIEPDTAAGLPKWDQAGAGGLPTKPDTGETIKSSDLRDGSGNFKRQASRFKVFQYPQQDSETYPNGGGTEITIGSVVDGKTVADIIWTVHLANKKTNTFVMVEAPSGAGFDAYLDNKLPPIRNPQEPPVVHDPTEDQKIQVLNDPDRVRKLTIDAGPRTIHGKNAAPVNFNKATTASYWKSGAESTPIADYPKSFPDDSFPHLVSPGGAIDTLGQLITDGEGCLLVLGGYGRAAAWQDTNGHTFPLPDDVNNDGWFDDTSDGPVSAVLVFDDGTVGPVQGGAWVTATDPSYAPQTMNAVSLWEDMYDVWVRNFDLVPSLYDRGFKDDFVPSFDANLNPIFQAAALQRWNTNPPRAGVSGHEGVAEIVPSTDPAGTPLSSRGHLSYIRGQDNRETSGTPYLMPLSLGDANDSALAMRPTQFFLLQKWAENWKANDWANNPDFTGPGPALGPGEKLDKAVLQNCLGGRFSPGIDATFVVRIPEIYIKDWQSSGGGPFRVKPKPLDYGSAQGTQPFLTEGYVPLRGEAGLEPGDVSKLMAIPWHTDYNSCSLHLPNPNLEGNITLFWSWPAQRPVAVYAAKDVKNGNLGHQRFSVRGVGTGTTDPGQLGVFQNRIDMVTNWHKIGVIMQGAAIDTDGGPFNANQYLEAESQLQDGGNVVEPWPFFKLNTVITPTDST